MIARKSAVVNKKSQKHKITLDKCANRTYNRPINTTGSEVKQIVDEHRKHIAEVAKKVAQLLAENQVTYEEVRRVFSETEKYLLITSAVSQNP